MKRKSRSGKGRVSDILVVPDICGVDINDPVGNHTVNFTITVESIIDETSPFDGDLELLLPHTLPKGVKTPKIELTKPETKWTTNLTTVIDDAFINSVKEKRLMYRIVFSYKGVSSSRLQAKSRRKMSDKAGGHINLSNTFFIDATSLLVRGGRFKPILSYTSSCKPPGFSNFSFTVSVDHPLLSDSQIRRHQPFVCFLRSVHQMPNTPKSYEELAESCVGPYLSLKSNVQMPTFCTIPSKHQSDLKLNIPFIFWASDNVKVTLELHDRDEIPADLTHIMGSSFFTHEQSVKQEKLEALSIDAIIGTKATNTIRPFGQIVFELTPGRYTKSFMSIVPKDTLVLPGNYVAAGTFLTVEMEDMKDYVSQSIDASAPVSTPGTKRGTPTSQSRLKEKVQVPFGLRRAVTVKLSESESAVSKRNLLQSTLVQCNAKVFNQKDLAYVPRMKIEQQYGDVISGFILITGVYELTILEFLENGENGKIITDLLSNMSDEDYKVFYDNTKTYQSPRLYGHFDCAIKKFKLAVPLTDLLREPQLYVQNSHLSDCHPILQILSMIPTSGSLNDFDSGSLWPSSSDLEILNAKKGTLLTLDELSFPPRDSDDSSNKASYASDKSKAETSRDDLVYIPLIPISNECTIKNPKYYTARNLQYISELNKRNKRDKKVVQRSEDGETEIVYCTPEEAQEDGWVVDVPGEFMPLYQQVSGANFSKNMRVEDGTEIRGGKKFYCFRTPRTFLEDKIKIKCDRNREPWTHGDQSLANCTPRLFKHIRGPILSDFKNTLRPMGCFDPNPPNIRDEYKEKINNGPTYEATAMSHPALFKAFNTPAMKDEDIVTRSPLKQFLNSEEPYMSPTTSSRNKDDNEIINKMRFKRVFPPRTKKGYTDSLYVAKIIPTFPAPKPGF